MKIKKEHIALYSMLGLVGLLSVSYFFVNQMVSADTIAVTKSTTVSIPAEFTAYDVETINSIGLDQIKNNGLILFSFNDPRTNFKNWSIYGPDCAAYKNTEQTKCFDTIQLATDTSYYIRNSKSAIKLLATSNKAKVALPSTLASGWHLTSWSGQDVRQSDFLKKLSLKDSGNQLQTLDYLIDQGIISTYIFEITKNNNEIVHKQLASIDSDKTTPSIKSNDSLWIYIFPSDKKFTSFAKTDAASISKSFSFGFNKSPAEFASALKKNINIVQEITNIGANLVRYVNFDMFVSTRQSDLARAEEIKNTGADLMGTWYPMGNIESDRNSTILSSKGQKYKTYAEVIADIKLYSKDSPDKLKQLLIEQYFKGIVIPRTTLYKDTTKNWQAWNEPNNLGDTGITAETLALLTTGQVETSNGTISFANQQIDLNGKKYSLENGASGLLKQICPDCKLVGGGFSGSNQEYFTTLKANKYMDYVDANDIHLNLMPSYSMNYTRYWFNSVDSTYNWLCGGRANCQKPLYSTEIGSPSNAELVEKVAGQPTGFSMTFTENFQADDLIKRLVALSAKGVSKISWNGFLDWHGDINGKSCPTSPNSSGFYVFNIANSICHHSLKGLYATVASGGYVKKPSYAAYNIATAMLGYASKIEILKKGDDERTEVDPVMLFKITDSDGKQKYSAWCEPFWNVNTTDLGKEAWNYEDRTCSKQIDLSEYGVKGTVSTTDRAGLTKEFKANNITLTQSPIFIELN